MPIAFGKYDVFPDRIATHSSHASFLCNAALQAGWAHTHAWHGTRVRGSYDHVHEE